MTVRYDHPITSHLHRARQRRISAQKPAQSGPVSLGTRNAGIQWILVTTQVAVGSGGAEFRDQMVWITGQGGE